MCAERYSLLLRATSYEDGEALVAHGDLQPGGANDVEVLAKPDASSQPCLNTGGASANIDIKSKNDVN